MNEISRLIEVTPLSVYILVLVSTMVYQLVACHVWKSENAFIRFIGTIMIQFPVLITILLIVNGEK